MAYHFRLETVLKYRRSLEEQAQLKLARQQMILDNQIRRLGELKVSRVRIAEDLEKQKKQTMTAARYRFYQYLMDNNERETRRQSNMIQAQQQVVEKARLELEEKVKARKIMENYRKRDYANYLREFLRKEYNENDELALLRFGRAGMNRL